MSAPSLISARARSYWRQMGAEFERLYRVQCGIPTREGIARLRLIADLLDEHERVHGLPSDWVRRENMIAAASFPFATETEG